MSNAAPATTDQALLALEAGRHAAAFRALKRLAENGDDSAFHMLAYLYDVGEGTRRNSAKALEWYLKSYRAGNSTSAMNIATMYRDSGHHRTEFAWYRRAAEMDDGDASVEVALRYLSGKGVRRNVTRAIDALLASLRSKNVSEGAKDTARQLLHASRRKKRLTIGWSGRD